MIEVVPLPPRQAGARRAKITYDLTINRNGSSMLVRSMIDFEYWPLGRGTWTDYIYFQVMGPRETFQRDLPVMLAQVFSMSENTCAVRAKSGREIAQANALAGSQREATARIADARFAANRAAGEATDRRIQTTEDIERDSTIRQLSATDFDEVIRGERTVEDTHTGERTSVALGDVHDIVDHLNEHDPDRYREVPLRDELYPLSGHENDRDYLARWIDETELGRTGGDCV